MMTPRVIAQSVSQSRSLAQLSDFAERLFWRLVASADDWGRLPAYPERVKAQCLPTLPHTLDAIADALGELEAAGRIARYREAYVETVQILDFDRYQPVAQLSRQPSRYP